MRASRTVLREPRGETPRGYSPDPIFPSIFPRTWNQSGANPEEIIVSARHSYGMTLMKSTPAIACPLKVVAVSNAMVSLGCMAN